MSWRGQDVRGRIHAGTSASMEPRGVARGHLVNSVLK